MIIQIFEALGKPWNCAIMVLFHKESREIRGAVDGEREKDPKLLGLRLRR